MMTVESITSNIEYQQISNRPKASLNYAMTIRPTPVHWSHAFKIDGVEKFGKQFYAFLPNRSTVY